MYRINENPMPRFPQGRPLAEDEGKWSVAHMKSRREKIFALELADEGIGYYLPLYEKRTRRRDNGKIRKSVMPLFPGYVALALGNRAFDSLFASRHAANILEVVDQKAFVKELSQIHRILEGNLPFEKHEKLFPGNKVRVRLGPFAGIEGVIIQKGKRTHLALSVEMFGQAISLNIEKSNLVRI